MYQPRRRQTKSNAPLLVASVALMSLVVLSSSTWADGLLPPISDIPATTSSPLNTPKPPLMSDKVGQQLPNERALLSKLELQVLGASSPNVALTQRIERLETIVFGGPQSGDLYKREAKLNDVIHVNNTSESPASSSPDMLQQMQDAFGKYRSLPPAEHQIPHGQSSLPPRGQKDATDYPTVTSLEQKVFHQSFVNDDITQRLDRLETKLYGHPNPGMALADRVDRLVAQVPVVARQQPFQTLPQQHHSYQNQSQSALDNLPKSASQLTNGQLGIYSQLETFERQLLGGPRPQLLITERLDQLEQQVFGKNYSGQSVDMRLARLRQNQQQSRAYSPPPRQLVQQQTYAPRSTTATPRQNIQIGSGMASNQTMTHRYSPEMMQMLPPNLQRQLGGSSVVRSTAQSPTVYQSSQSTTGGGLGWGRKTVSRQSSTVMMPQGGTVTSTEERYLPGNFSPYGYQAPVISRSITRSNLGTPLYGSSSANTRNQVIANSSSFSRNQIQAISTLENRLYGRVQPSNMQPDYRLQVMEQGILGQSYTHLSTQQRIQQLQQAAGQVNQNLRPSNSNGLLGTLANTLTRALNPSNNYSYYGGMPQTAANSAWGY